MKVEDRHAMVIGAGGHGKVVASLLQELGFRVTMVLDDDPAKWGGKILSIPVKGPVSEFIREQDTVAIIGIGDNRTRVKVAEANHGARWITAVHPFSWVHPSVKIGEGSVVFAGSVIQPDTLIGKHCIINTGVAIDHDCRIGDGVHIAPGCHLSGGVSVGQGAFLGVGVSVIPCCTIGRNAIVGAGACVIGDIPEGTTAVGVPAKAIKKA